MTRHDSIKLRHKRIRKKVSGTSERPRLSVNFSGRHIRAQVIDDTKGLTLAAASTQEAAVGKSGANVANAQAVGRLVAERSKAKSVSKVVFDRGGFQYQGKVKALADAAREAGLDF
jgi:large subunit ribosomal protein L18